MEKTENWILFLDKILFVESGINSWYINLLKDIWEDMIYWKQENIVIDYPGEYDIQDIYFKVITSESWKLSYYIKTGEEAFCIIQDKSALDDETFQLSEKIYYISEIQEGISDKIEKNEIHAELISI